VREKKTIMNVAIPPEFEAFAREQVAAGRFLPKPRPSRTR
jgi:hypothetical protein